MDVIAWLLDADPAIRWQTMRDLAGGDADGERARVAREGLGAEILRRQDPDGGWSMEGEPAWVPTFKRGEHYLIERAMFRRRSTGAVASDAFLAFAFPTRCWYDVLRGLDYLRDVGGTPVADAVRVVEQRRQPDGTWHLDASHPDGLTLSIDEHVGAPSRWNTLRALRVLRWAT